MIDRERRKATGLGSDQDINVGLFPACLFGCVPELEGNSLISSMQTFHNIKEKTGSEPSGGMLEVTQLVSGRARPRPRSCPSNSEPLPILEASPQLSVC